MSLDRRKNLEDRTKPTAIGPDKEIPVVEEEGEPAPEDPLIDEDTKKPKDDNPGKGPK